MLQLINSLDLGGVNLVQLIDIEVLSMNEFFFDFNVILVLWEFVFDFE